MESAIRFFVIITIIGFAFVSCPEPEPPALTGTVSISGHAQVGQTLTAETDNLGGSGTISYEWRRDGTTVIGNGSTYTIQNEDIDSTITVTVIRSDNSGSVTSTQTTVVVNSSIATLGLDFTLINNGAAYSVSKGTSNASVVVIPQVYNGLPVVEIADSGFSSYTNLTSIILPDGVSRIGTYAFFNCSNLTGIVIPAVMTNIGNSAFQNCTSLTAVFYGGVNNTEWSTITIGAAGAANAPLINASRYYYSAVYSDVLTNHWFFVDGEPTVWELNITQPAVITNVIAGNISGNLSVAASVGNAALSYQWYSNTTNSNTGGSLITGATNSSFTIPSTLTAGTYYYFCEVSIAGGAMLIRSDVARVNVSVPVITINTQPAAITDLTIGDISGSLSVGASVTGNAALSYQWYSNATNSNIGGELINGATSSSYTIPTTLSAGTYYYFCEVRATNGAQSIRSNVARVNVSAPVISINKQPTPTVVFTGKLNGNLSVTASVTGNADLSYQWYSNTINSYTGGIIITGATSSNYVVPMTHPLGTYYYFCEVSATSGATTVRSSIVRVGVISSITPIEMVQVPGGSFELGRELNSAVGGSDVTPVSTVNISGFYMGKYQVTQEQYLAVMGGTNPSGFHGGSGREPASGEVQERRPVENVSWYDALVFCNRLSIMEGLTPAYRISGSTNPDDWGTVPIYWDDAKWDAVQIVSGSTGYRLPTEAQWEYAAKGGSGSPGNFTYSGSNDPDTVAWYWENSGGITHEVGKKAPNSLGLYDMSGNVWEWCWDWWGSYTSTAKTDPRGAAAGSYRVRRGGCWSNSAEITQSVSRIYVNPDGWTSVVGFRLVRP